MGLLLAFLTGEVKLASWLADNWECGEPPEPPSQEGGGEGASCIPDLTEGVHFMPVFKWARRRRAGSVRPRSCSWPKSELVPLTWACFILDIRYIRFRGWRPVRLKRVGLEGEVLWPPPQEGECDEEEEPEPGS